MYCEHPIVRDQLAMTHLVGDILVPNHCSCLTLNVGSLDIVPVEPQGVLTVPDSDIYALKLKMCQFFESQLGEATYCSKFGPAVLCFLPTPPLN